MKYYSRKIIDIFYLILARIFLTNNLDNQPFFILSPGRSGSTFLRKEIIENTNANIPPETGDLIIKSAKIYINNIFRSNRTRRLKILEEFVNHPDFKFWNLDAELLRKKISNIKISSFQKIINFIYAEYALIHGFDNNSWGDKTPYLTERIIWLKSLFPKAKYVFIDRDTEAVKNSRMTHFNETEQQALKRIINSRKAIQKAKRNNYTILFIKLEEFLAERETHLNSIIDFLSLEKLDTPKINFYLGDDVLNHHEKLHENLD